MSPRVRLCLMMSSVLILMSTRVTFFISTSFASDTVTSQTLPSVTMDFNPHALATTPVDHNEAQKEESRKKAAEWGLTDIEWQRYEKLMRGPRGIWTPTLDPITVLGNQAETSDERRHFAEILVRMEHQRLLGEIAFEHAHYDAAQRFYPDEKTVDFGSTDRSINNIKNDLLPKRIIFFADTQCLSACMEEVKTLSNLVDNNPTITVDTYVAGCEGDDNALRTWATSVGMSADLVRARRMTLDHETGLMAKLHIGASAFPVTLLRTADGQLTPFHWQE